MESQTIRHGISVKQKEIASIFPQSQNNKECLSCVLLTSAEPKRAPASPVRTKKKKVLGQMTKDFLNSAITR